MPKKCTQRTFTGCWSCRRRNVRCDNAVPSCSQCRQMRIKCEGYQIRLVWVDSDTGTYVHRQRRGYPCELTWDGYELWSLEEVGHLIETEHGECKCKLHRFPSPFGVFSRKRRETREAGMDMGTISYPSQGSHHEENQSRPEDDISSVGRGATTEVENTSPIGSDALVPYRPNNTCSVHRGHVPKNPIASCTCHDPAAFTMTSIVPLFQSITLSGTSDENRLFYHYVAHTSMEMIPIDSFRNPWKSTYPSIALSSSSSSSARALYYAILSQSSYHLANLKGEAGGNERANAMTYYGKSIRKLRESLCTPTEEYSSVLAALLTINFAEHVFQGKSQGGWRNHFKGAMGFVKQYLARQPWKLSDDALIITQNFALEIVLAQTTTDCSQSSAANIAEVYSVLLDVMAARTFGFTIGGTALLIKTIYEARLLEEQLATNESEIIDGKIMLQANYLIEQLQISLNDEVETYASVISPDDTHAKPHIRTMANLHLRLFNSAVIIYLFRMVLRFPPSYVTKHVNEVLSDAVAFMDKQYGSVSIWPVFIAAVEAYTEESKVLARRFLGAFAKTGVGNREDILDVIFEVWKEREKVASEKDCDPGKISVDWRAVMKRLDTNILLL